MAKVKVEQGQRTRSLNSCVDTGLPTSSAVYQGSGRSSKNSNICNRVDLDIICLKDQLKPLVLLFKLSGLLATVY